MPLYLHNYPKIKFNIHFLKSIIKFQLILYVTNVINIFCFTLSSLALFFILGSLLNVNWKIVMIQENLIANIHKFRSKIFEY